MAFVVRMAAAVTGTRIAAAAGQYGLIGTAAGLLVTSAIVRWPGKALLVGVAYGASKLWTRRNQNVALIEDRSGETVTPTPQSAI